MNPKLADEPPKKVDKVESIFMKDDEQIKGIQTMNLDEETIMRSINDKKASNLAEFDVTKSDIKHNIFEHIIDETDLMMMYPTEQPSGFSTATKETISSSLATTPTPATTTNVNLLSTENEETATVTTMESIDLTTTLFEDSENGDVTTERN